MNITIYQGEPLRRCEKTVRKESHPLFPKWNKCSRYTAFFIDGKPYCKEHAGELALLEMLKCVQSQNS